MLLWLRLTLHVPGKKSVFSPADDPPRRQEIKEKACYWRLSRAEVALHFLLVHNFLRTRS